MAFSNYWRGDRDRDRDQEDWRENREWSGRDETPDVGFRRRGQREGSDYYGNNPRSYGSTRSVGRPFESSRGDSQSAGSRGGRSLNDRWQNAYGNAESEEGYGGRSFRGYSGYTGYGGGDYGERDSDRGFESFGPGGIDPRFAMSERGGYRGRGPKGYRRSDERVREDVCECLTEDDDIDATNIEVHVKDCEVTIAGTVSSRDEKRRAEALIERLAGVKDVHNQLRIAAQDASQGGQSTDDRRGGGQSRGIPH